MERIVDGILYEGKYLADSWDVRVWAQNGVIERSARQVVSWQEVGPVPPLDQVDPVLDAEWVEERRLLCLRKAASRAKTMCRRVIIAENFDELLTLTYRENQVDRVLCKKHFAEWSRRMKRALSGFRYCASFEKQKRGAMHIHIATRKLPEHASYKGVKVKAWQLGTAIWRDIVGKDNGMCFVGGRTRWGTSLHKKMSLAKMASYVSKYITKDYEDAPEESNRYSRSNGITIASTEVTRFVGYSLREIIDVTFDLSPGDILISHRIGYFKDAVWLCSEAPA